MSRMLIRLQYEIQHHYNRWKIIVLITCLLTAASSDLLLKPENSWALNGSTEPVILKCNSTFGYRLNWLIKACRTSEKFRIFNGYRLSNNVTSYCSVINGAPGKYELNLTATTNAAQQYVCREPGTLMEASAELIIIESHPECSNVTTAGELTTLSCHLRFHGNWAPAMEWSMVNNNEVISEGVNNTRDGKSLTSRLVVPANQSHNHKLHYICTTKFRIQEKPMDTTADNIPSYNHAWIYRAEPHKGVDSDGAKDDEEEKDPEEKSIKPLAVATSTVVTLMSVGLIGGLVYYNKRKKTKKNVTISKEEATEFMESQ